MTLAVHIASRFPDVVVGVSIGKTDDKSTWRLDFKQGASTDGIAEAEAFVAGFDVASWVASETTTERAALVRAECSRRMCALVGARDAEHLAVIISNGVREQGRLQAILTGIPGVLEGREWTAEEAARAGVLWQIDAALEALRAASNALEPNPPADFTDDRHWPPIGGAS